MIWRAIGNAAQVAAVMASVGQAAAPPRQPHAAIQAEEPFPPAGPFQFEAGTTSPTFMDAFDTRPVVLAPDGNLGVTVTGPKKSLGAWVTLSTSALTNGPVQVWPIEASVSILWRPDSKAFALTDNRYANLSYVLVCGTEFRTGEDEPGLGVEITDLTPTVRKALDESAKSYYGASDYGVLSFYPRVLRWIGSDRLLVGVSGMTSGPVALPNRGLKDWETAYVINTTQMRVDREVNKEQLLADFKIKMP